MFMVVSIFFSTEHHCNCSNSVLWSHQHGIQLLTCSGSTENAASTNKLAPVLVNISQIYFIISIFNVFQGGL